MSTTSSELADRLIKFFRNYYRDEIGELAQAYPDDQRSLVIDYDDLYQFDSDLADDYCSQPTQMREYAEEALRAYDLPADVRLGNAHVRLANLPKTHALQEIRSRHVGRFLQIHGTVASESTVRSLVDDASFECQRCGTVNFIPQQEPATPSNAEEPHECQGCERNGPFEIDYEQSELVDAQTLVVEQQIRGSGADEDIETIEVRLSDDLVENVELGDAVTVTGTLHISRSPLSTTITDKYLDTHYIKSVDPHDHIEITQSDVERFVELSNRDAIYDDIVGSIAPTISGYEEEKLALALQLFSGIRKELPDGSTVRGDIHVLLMGDPGTSKSPLIRAAGQLAPRAVTISGTDTTPVGLTAAATPSSGDADPWEIKGGALVKANNGLTAIDNLGGFKKEHFEGLHSTLEQQEIDVSKATVTKTLPAETSVAAAANPKYGRFDQYEPIGEQLDIPARVISQFDLIFTMSDMPDPDRDRDIARHITTKHHVGEVEAKRSHFPDSEIQSEDIDEKASELTPEIDTELLRKYIVHARQACFPEFTEEAKKPIEDFYVDFRSKGADEDAPIPITARKIEAIVRLAEASARIRLSDTIAVEDAERAVDIVRACMQDIGIDPEVGQFDADVVETGSSKSQQSTKLDELVNKIPSDGYPSIKEVTNQAEKEGIEIKKVNRTLREQTKHLISNIEKEYDEGAPIEEVLNRHNELGISRAAVEKLIEKLRRTGEVYEPKKDHFRTT